MLESAKSLPFLNRCERTFNLLNLLQNFEIPDAGASTAAGPPNV